MLRLPLEAARREAVVRLSDCRWGVNPRLFTPRCNVREYDQTEPIRCKLVYEGSVRPSEFTAGRMAKDESDGTIRERVPKYVEVDGVRFTPDGIDLVEHYEGGRCVAVTLDGVDYVRGVYRETVAKTCPKCGKVTAWTVGLFEPKQCTCGERFEQ